MRRRSQQIGRTLLRNGALRMVVKSALRRISRNFGVTRALAGIHVEHDADGSVAGLGLSDQVAVHRHQPDEVVFMGPLPGHVSNSLPGARPTFGTGSD